MKELRWITLILAVAVILMGIQTYGLYQQQKALQTTLDQAETELAQIRESIDSISETSRIFNEFWQQIEEKRIWFQHTYPDDYKREVGDITDYRAYTQSLYETI